MRLTTLAASTLLSGYVSAALAQGGPPLVTDDPDTPGDGKWEINVASIYSRMPHRQELAAPDIDANYGWGDYVQLKLDIPWVFARDSGEPWKSGAGTAQAGVKWRFIDEKSAGFNMSTYPQLSWNIVPSSASRGVTSEGKEFFLPVEASKDVGGFGLDAEIGRNFVDGGPNEWAAGAIASHGCGKDLECMAEIHQTVSPGVHETLLNFGVHWKLSESFVLLAALGREGGTANAEQRRTLAYLGVQILR